jgi:hypothetical protein
MNAAPPSRSSRERAAPELPDFDANTVPLQPRVMLLEASAGTGKTFALAHLVLRLVTRAEDPLPLERLLVVTFTEAAAAELRDRIALRLQQGLAVVEAVVESGVESGVEPTEAGGDQAQQVAAADPVLIPSAVSGCAASCCWRWRPSIAPTSPRSTASAAAPCSARPWKPGRDRPWSWNRTMANRPPR